MHNTVSPTDQLRNAGYNLLEAIAYGDSAGLPFETMDAVEIEDRYGYVETLVVPAEHRDFAGESFPGVWSDDTHLSMAVAEGLVAAEGFDIREQAKALIKAFIEASSEEREVGSGPRGWGKATRRSAQRLADGWAPQLSGDLEGVGNGVVMKLAPLVLWQAARDTEPEERYAQYDALTSMTHNTDVARWASRLHGDVLLGLLTEDEREFANNMAEFVVSRSEYHETALGMNHDATDALRFLEDKTLMRDREGILDNTDRKGFYVPQTLAMAYGAYMYLPANFRYGVYEAVNLGGDADSIASITAAMLNFGFKGIFKFPDDAELLLDRYRIRKVSKTLTDLALKGFME